MHLLADGRFWWPTTVFSVLIFSQALRRPNYSPVVSNAAVRTWKLRKGFDGCAGGQRQGRQGDRCRLQGPHRHTAVAWQQQAGAGGGRAFGARCVVRAAMSCTQAGFAAGWRCSRDGGRACPHTMGQDTCGATSYDGFLLMLTHDPRLSCFCSITCMYPESDIRLMMLRPTNNVDPPSEV